MSKITKLILTNDGFEYVHLDAQVIRFEIGEKSYIECQISESKNGKNILSISGNDWKLSQIKIIPKVSNSIDVGFED